MSGRGARTGSDVSAVELEVRALGDDHDPDGGGDDGEDHARGWDDDDLALGADPHPRRAWRRPHPSTWSRRRRAVAVTALGAAAVLAGAAVVQRAGDAGPPAARPSLPAARAPGATVRVPLDTDPSWCPREVPCTTTDDVGTRQLAAFHAAFPSAGYIGTATVVGTDNGVVYRQVVRFSTGTLVTVTLTQQPVIMLAEPPVVDATPDARDLDGGSLHLTALRDGYLLTADLAGLPGQVLPVGSARRWLGTVPSAGPAVS